MPRCCEEASEGHTDDQGRYRLEGVGAYLLGHVQAELSGYVDGQTENFEIEGSGEIKAPDLVMRRGAVVTLRVRTPSGQPARAASVDVEIDTGASESITSMTDLLAGDTTYTTDAEGKGAPS